MPRLDGSAIRSGCHSAAALATVSGGAFTRIEVVARLHQRRRMILFTPLASPRCVFFGIAHRINAVAVPATISPSAQDPADASLSICSVIHRTRARLDQEVEHLACIAGDDLRSDGGVSGGFGAVHAGVLSFQSLQALCAVILADGTGRPLSGFGKTIPASIQGRKTPTRSDFVPRGNREVVAYVLVPVPHSSEALRSAWRSPQTNPSAKAAANHESRLPIDRTAARLTTVSSASLAKVAFVQRRASASSADRVANTAPRPRTRSRIPIVLIRRRAAPVGDSVPARRMGAPGATINAIPTDDRSHPIESVPIVATARA